MVCREMWEGDDDPGDIGNHETLKASATSRYHSTATSTITLSLPNYGPTPDPHDQAFTPSAIRSRFSTLSQGHGDIMLLDDSMERDLHEMPSTRHHSKATSTITLSLPNYGPTPDPHDQAFTPSAIRSRFSTLSQGHGDIMFLDVSRIGD